LPAALICQPNPGWAGGQLTYGIKILKGAQPGALPVERLMRRELIVNLGTALPEALRWQMDG
jgi:hypothetical protein